MAIKHEQIREHLRSRGFRVGKASVKKRLADFAMSSMEFAATSDELGVLFLWSRCDKDCITQPHVHVIAKIRLAAGQPFRDKGTFIITDLSQLDEFRGAPAERSKITKKQMPPPYEFKKARFVAVERTNRATKYERIMTISTAMLLGPVGITDNAKVCEDMAARPDEPVWWHFSCSGQSTATFNIITDGDVWYPVNRRSLRITTQLKPKKSIDLSTLSVDDRDFLLYIIADYVQKM